MNSSELMRRLARALCRWAVPTSIVLAAAGAHSEDLGVVGPTYAIQEHDAVAMLKHRLAVLQAHGGLAALEQRARRRAMQDITDMPAVPGVSTSTEYAQRLVDPTVTYSKPVLNDEGAVIVPAGTRINPLDIETLHERLVFFDGRDPTQVKATHALVDREGVAVKPILTGGSWLDLTKAWKRQVYFDQQGRLTQRFGITHVPTVVSQKGNQLLLEEEPAAQLR